MSKERKLMCHQFYKLFLDLFFFGAIKMPFIFMLSEEEKLKGYWKRIRSVWKRYSKTKRSAFVFVINFSHAYRFINWRLRIGQQRKKWSSIYLIYCSLSTKWQKLIVSFVTQQLCCDILTDDLLTIVTLFLHFHYYLLCEMLAV